MRRGEIHYRERARQLRNYSGLCFGNITPTDIDGLIEYHGKAYLIIEVKLNNTRVSFGQRLALERLTDDLLRPSMCIIAMHEIENPLEDIDVAKCLVSEYRFKGEWRIPKVQRNVRELIEIFLKLIDDIGDNLILASAQLFIQRKFISIGI
jgi:hypothetical protein